MFKKKCYLKALDLSVPLTYGQSYHDDGYVSSIADYAVQQRFGVTQPLIPEIRRAWIEKYNREHQLGITITIEKSGFFSKKRETRIAYLNLREEIINLYARGRQETDALREMGHLNELEEVLAVRFSLPVSCLKTEGVVDAGGIYALLKQYTPWEIANYNGRMTDSMGSKMRIALLSLTRAPRKLRSK